MEPVQFKPTTSQFAERPTAAEVSLRIQRLVTLLQHLRKPATKTIQGLWAELFLIGTYPKPEQWIRSWHTDPMGLHDFIFGDLRVEVKSRVGTDRIHRFSHDQLVAPSQVSLFIASILVERSNRGESIYDVAERIRRHLAPEDSLSLDSTITSTLGSDYLKAEEIRFDPIHAESSLLFFPLSTVPRLTDDIPNGVMDVSYTVRLLEADGMRKLPFAEK